MPNDEVRAAIERALLRSGQFPSNLETALETLRAQINALAAENAVCKLMAKAALPSGSEWNRVEGQSAALKALAVACHRAS